MSATSLTLLATLVSLACCAQLPTTLTLTSHVIGGKSSSATFNVLLRSKNGKKYCSASVISPRWVLLAGHCTKYLRSGDSALIANSTFPPFRLERVVHHPQYDGDFRNDVALARLNSPAPPRGDVIPLARDIPPPNALVTLYGYGAIDTRTTGHSTLRKVDLRTVGYSACRRMLYGTGHGRVARRLDRSIHLCANQPRRVAGLCDGDSGGPLVYNGRQIGIAMGRIEGCGDVNEPDIFARVSTYVQWIETIVGHSLDAPKKEVVPPKKVVVPPRKVVVPPRKVVVPPRKKVVPPKKEVIKPIVKQTPTPVSTPVTQEEEEDDD